MQFSAIFSAVSGCKKAYDAVSNLRKTPEEAYILWQMLDAIEPAVTVASRLQGRYETCAQVRATMSFVHETIHLCDTILTRDEPNGRPYEADSWSEWWESVPSKAKESLTRLQIVPKLTQRVVHCVSLLQLAITSATALSGPGRPLGAQSFQLLSGAVEDSRKIFHLFEAGRLDNFFDRQCPQYQLAGGKLGKTDGSLVSQHAALILRRTVQGSYELLFMDAEAIASLREQSNESTATGAKTVVPQAAKAVTPLEVLNPSDWTTPVQRNVKQTTIQYMFPSAPSSSSSSPELKWVFTFNACTVPGQYCYFPNGNETYVDVTAEVLDVVLASCRALCRSKGTPQVDRVVPLFTDDADTAERQTMMAFMREHFNGSYE